MSNHWEDILARPQKSVQSVSYTLDSNDREAGNEAERVHTGTDYHHVEGS